MINTVERLEQKTHVQPRTCALLTCEHNIMPLAWHMPFSKEPFRYGIALRDENYSFELLQEHGEFALNFLDVKYHAAYETCGSIHGHDIDKFERAGLQAIEAKSIHTHLIEEAYLIYECRIIDRINYGDHNVFVADVLHIHNKDITDVSPTLFLGKGYYDTLKNEPRRIERN